MVRVSLTRKSGEAIGEGTASVIVETLGLKVIMQVSRGFFYIWLCRTLKRPREACLSLLSDAVVNTMTRKELGS